MEIGIVTVLTPAIRFMLMVFCPFGLQRISRMAIESRVCVRVLSLRSGIG